MESNEPPGSSSATGALRTPEVIGSRGFIYYHAQQSIIVALAINFCIAAIKFLAWFISRSPSMLSEALHSLGDGINSIALLIGLRLSSRSPDESHPFGYGLEASVWAIPACAFLLIFSLLAVWEGWSRLLDPHEAYHLLPGFEWVDPFAISVVVLLISIILEVLAVRNAVWAIQEEVGLKARGLPGFIEAYRHIKHVVAPTTRFVFYEETIALLGAILALIAISLSHYSVELGWLSPQFAHWPDALASIIIGLMLMGMSIYLFIHNRGILTGTAASPKTEQRISDLVLNLHGVSEIHDLKTVDRGPAGLTIHMQVEVEPDTMVKDVDDLTERIKDKIQDRISNVSQVFIEVLADESDVEWGKKFIALIEQGRVEEVLNAREEILLRNVYDFTESTVQDVMVPRTDVDAVALSTPLEEVADLILETGHSRLPVYGEDMDDIVGIVHARDVFERIRKQEMTIPLSELIREIDIYPENKPVTDLLEDFKRNKIQMAVVADEHGGFAGLVTIEDLMEEIVGEIWDEHDEEDSLLEVLTPNQVLISGKYNIEDLNEELTLNVPSDEFKTIGGFVFGQLGREPDQGDAVTFEELTLTVQEVEGPRIVSILITSPVPFELEKVQEPSEP